MTSSPNSQGRLKVALIAPSLRYVGGQAVQADLLLRLWQSDPDVDVSLITVDPPLPRWLAFANPALLTLGIVFLGAASAVGRAFLVPAAPNVAHVVFFVLAAGARAHDRAS